MPVELRPARADLLLAQADPRRILPDLRRSRRSFIRSRRRRRHRRRQRLCTLRRQSCTHRRRRSCMHRRHRRHLRRSCTRRRRLCMHLRRQSCTRHRRHRLQPCARRRRQRRSRRLLLRSRAIRSRTSRNSAHPAAPKTKRAALWAARCMSGDWRRRLGGERGLGRCDHIGLERRVAIEADRGVGRGIGAGRLDQHLVADGE